MRLTSFKPTGSDRGLDPTGDHLRAHSKKRAMRWDLVLIWFMRVLALLWIAKGLASWASILGAVYLAGPFEGRSTGFQATTIYFAVIDLVAAVGLWLTSTWGGVMWLLAIMSHLILAVFFPSYVPSNAASVASFLSLIGTYLALSWLGARDG